MKDLLPLQVLNEKLPWFCRNVRRPWIPIAVTKTTYGTSAFGYSWYFTNPSLFLFFVFFLMISILGRWAS